MVKPQQPRSQPPMLEETAVARPSEKENPTHSALQSATETFNPRAEVSIPVALHQGSVIGPYALLEKLGQGGMGAVYKVRHQHLEKLFALKVLPHELTNQPELVSRFQREMKAVGKLDHPNIVRATDGGVVDGTHYLVMEYVEGTDLTNLVKSRGRCSVNNTCVMLHQAAKGLASAHQNGLIHRDIKPSNLLLTNKGQVKILDLGLARLQGDTVQRDHSLTTMGQILGTPDYMAPEQWSDIRTADQRTDLYALGCTLFFLLTGKSPYSEEKHSSWMQKMRAHALEPPPDLRSLRPDVPESLDLVYRRLMAKDPADRVQTADELAKALATIVRELKNPESQSLKGSPASEVMAQKPSSELPQGPMESTLAISAPAKDAQSLQSLSASIDSFKAARVATKSNSRSMTQSSAKTQVRRGAGDPRNRRWIAGGVVGILVLLGVIVITITNRDGSRTKIEVASDATQVEIAQSGKSSITIETRPQVPKLEAPPSSHAANANQFPVSKDELPSTFNAMLEGTSLTGWQGLVADPKQRATMSADELTAAQRQADEQMRAHWKVADGVLQFDGQGDNLCTVREYGDFEFYLEWKIGPGGDSGVYLRGAPQVQIWDSAAKSNGENMGSGGLYNNKINPRKPLIHADRPVGEWNAMLVRMEGDKVTVGLNGQLVVDKVVFENYFDSSQPIYPKGPIELQKFGSPLSFRNLMIRELPRTLESNAAMEQPRIDAVNVAKEVVDSSAVAAVPVTPIATATKDNPPKADMAAHAERIKSAKSAKSANSEPAPKLPPVTLNLKPGTPISSPPLVGSPTIVKGLESWSVELAGHADAGLNRGVAIHPDGNLIATAGIVDNTIRLWRLEDLGGTFELALDRVLLGESGAIWDLSWSPSGHTLAVCTQIDKRVTLYDVATGRRWRSFSLDCSAPHMLAWSPDGRMLAVPTGSKLAIIEAISGAVKYSESSSNYVCGAWSPNSQEFVSLEENGKVSFWDPKTLELLGGATNPTLLRDEAIAWSPDGKWVAIGGKNGRVTFWDPVLRRMVKEVITDATQQWGVFAWEPAPPAGIDKHPHWPRLLMVSGGAQIWDATISQKLATLTTDSQCGGAVWSSDGRHIVLVSDRPHVYDASTGALLADAQFRTFASCNYHVSADGKTLRACQRDQMLLFSAESGEYLKRFGNMPTSRVMASPKDDWLACYDPLKVQDHLFLVDTATYEKRIPLTGHSQQLTGVNWSPDAKQLASSSIDGTVRLWKAANGTMLHLLQHDRPVRNVVWGPDGKFVATVAEDDVIRVWSVESGSEVKRFGSMPSPSASGPAGIAWSPNNDRIAIASLSGGAILLDLKSGRFTDPFLSASVGLQEVAWSPDAKQVIVVDFGTCVGYRAVNSQEKQVVQGHGAPIQWLPDSRRVVTGQTGGLPLQAMDTRKGNRMGALFPMLADGGWLCIGADGHYRGSEGIESQIVYVALHKDGSQTTHTAADFAKRFGWENDPDKASFLKLRNRSR